jgi:hypothetical protein
MFCTRFVRYFLKVCTWKNLEDERYYPYKLMDWNSLKMLYYFTKYLDLINKLLNPKKEGKRLNSKGVVERKLLGLSF